MAVDMAMAREYASLGGSALALASTMYFWLVRANRERAQLTVHPIKDICGRVVLHQECLSVYHRLLPADKRYCVMYWLHLAVVNNSSLPNALLGARISLQLGNGEWREMDVQHEAPDTELFPVNIDPLTTCSLKLALATITPDCEFQNDFAGREALAGDMLPRQVPIRIELQGLQDRIYKAELLDSGNGLSRTVVQPRAAAA
ncbi:hypothetical protein SAMN06265222_101415 [Neorhodopirellula lusitana]|uniref:Uncharacterized protein n=2 Tax=Neorhodopirellula lusitana TaxID=445327 RepID=A0ABY1PQS4_9BACT|nr:hypothetical protein SAMN06265222_101415 [Neorhodopirellula lusitana]